ncbi:MAG: patatin-like phospholipase family protein [Eubacteriaceae bacterium]
MTKYGLVFSGGGARGAYEIGVWEALDALNIQAEAVVGTSIGAINGVFYAQQALSKAKEIWKNLDAKQIFGENNSIFFMSIEPLRRLLEKNVDEALVRSSPIRFGLATYNLTTMKTEYRFIEEIPEGELVSFLLASANVPIFKREIINDQRYIDGGVTDTIPWKMLLNDGYKNIISVMADFHGYSKPNQKDLNNILFHEIIHSDTLGSFLSIDRKVIHRNYLMGYFDTKKSFGVYKGNWYYIRPSTDQNSLQKLSFSKNDIRLLNRNQMTQPIIQNPLILKRLFLHLILSKYWKMDLELTWHSLFTCCCELTAEVLDIPRYKAYTLIQLIQEILNTIKIIETSKTYTHLKNDPLLVSTYRLSQEKRKRAFYIVALSNNMPLIPGVIHGASFIAPDLMIAIIMLTLLKAKNFIS